MYDKPVVIGMAGAGRATELHIGGYTKVHGVPVRLKTIADLKPEQLLRAKDIYGFENATTDFDEMVRDPDIDVIDICTPPYVHVEMIEKAIKAGKHVICEKPLSGYFGMQGDPEPIGTMVSKQQMYDRLCTELEALQRIVDESGRLFMYAENFVYAPAVQRAAEIIRARKSRILFMKGEESLKGSSSPVAGEWSKTGGGTFIRTGTHPLSAILYLKQQEALAHGATVSVQSVLGDMANLTADLTAYEHRSIAAQPHDVEDFGSVILTFTDGTKASVTATDTLLGGSKNRLELYCNDAAINCTLTLADMMETYLPDEDGMDGVTLSEMLPVKTGWNRPFVADDVIRGYAGEMQDFMECAATGRQPESGFALAADTIRMIYAGYLSAETGHLISVL